MSRWDWEACSELEVVDEISTGSKLLASITGAAYTVEGTEDEAIVSAGVESTMQW